MEPGQRAQGVGMQRALGLAGLGDLAVVPLRNRARQACALLGRQVGEQRAHDAGVPDVDHEPFQARRAQRVHGEAEELEVSLGPCHARQLDADLGDLPVLSCPAAASAKHGSLVAEPERRRATAKPGRDDPGDLRRHVGTQRRDFARLRLDEPEHVRRVEHAEAALEDLGELEDRGRDERVAVQREAVEDAAGERASGGGLFGQEVAHPRGERVFQ